MSRNSTWTIYKSTYYLRIVYLKLATNWKLCGVSTYHDCKKFHVTELSFMARSSKSWMIGSGGGGGMPICPSNDLSDPRHWYLLTGCCSSIPKVGTWVVATWIFSYTGCSPISSSLIQSKAWPSNAMVWQRRVKRLLIRMELIPLLLEMKELEVLRYGKMWD